MSSNECFNPEMVANINKAYEAALERLGLQSTSADRRVQLGKCLFDLARDGETDPDKLRDAAIGAMKRLDWIRHEAHELWEADGRPHDRHEEHWIRAEQEFEAHKHEIG